MSNCKIAPPGWSCSRPSEHDGPCAAWPVTSDGRREHTFDDVNGFADALAVERDAARAEVSTLQAENEQLQKHLADALGVDAAERQRLWATLRVHPFVRDECQRLTAENERLAAQVELQQARGDSHLAEYFGVKACYEGASARADKAEAELADVKKQLEVHDMIADHNRERSREFFVQVCEAADWNPEFFHGEGGQRLLDRIRGFVKDARRVGELHDEKSALERIAAARQAMLHDVNTACQIAVKCAYDLATMIDHMLPDLAPMAKVTAVRAALAPSKPTFALAEATRDLVKAALGYLEDNPGGGTRNLYEAQTAYTNALAALEKRS